MKDVVMAIIEKTFELARLIFSNASELLAILLILEYFGIIEPIKKSKRKKKSPKRPKRKK